LPVLLLPKNLKNSGKNIFLKKSDEKYLNCKIKKNILIFLIFVSFFPEKTQNLYKRNTIFSFRFLILCIYTYNLKFHMVNIYLIVAILFHFHHFYNIFKIVTYFSNLNLIKFIFIEILHNILKKLH